MPIKLLNLNIEGSKNLEKIILFISKNNFDVFCFQEIFKEDYLKLKKHFNLRGSFYSMAKVVDIKKGIYTSTGDIGVAILTKLPYDYIKGYSYVNNGRPIFNQLNVKNQFNINRVLVYGKIYKNNTQYNIATTHFQWSQDGKPNKYQWNAFNRLIKFLDAFENLILCGDFNFPRGGAIYKKFLKTFVDNLPLDIKSTLDPINHRFGDKNIVVDYVFSKGNYMVMEVKTFEGLSDHKAITGKIKMS